MAAELNLEELQRRLDAAKREQQKARAASAPKAQAARQATLVVKSDSACLLSIDGQPVGVLEAGVARIVTTSVGEALVECQSSAESGARYSLAYKFEADTKVVIQIELRDKIASARRKRETPVTQSHVAPGAKASQAISARTTTQAASAAVPVAVAASAARPPSSPPAGTATAPRGSVSGASTPGSATQEWSSAVAELRRDSTLTSLAKGLSTLLQVKGAEDARQVEQFEAMMTRLSWHTALAMGVRSGYIQYGYAHRQQRATWAQESALASCKTRSQQPCSVVLMDGQLNQAGLVEFASRLGAQPQTMVLRDFIRASQVTLKNAP
jgi:hypothetical protein